jgi:hypothetical protein
LLRTGPGSTIDPFGRPFRVVVAGAQVGLPEVKVIELIPFTQNRLKPALA